MSHDNLYFTTYIQTRIPNLTLTLKVTEILNCYFDNVLHLVYFVYSLKTLNCNFNFCIYIRYFNSFWFAYSILLLMTSEYLLMKP